MKQYVYPVRWLCTLFSGGNLYHRNDTSFSAHIEALQWELSTNREKSFGYTNGLGVGSAWLGLLVDLPVSEIDVIYREDCYSLRYQYGLKLISNERNKGSNWNRPHDKNGEQLITSYAPKQKEKYRKDTIPIKPSVGSHALTYEGSYHEALGYLKFCGIVLSASCNTKLRIDFAKDMAKRFDLPYLGKLRTFRPGKYMSYSK